MKKIIILFSVMALLFACTNPFDQKGYLNSGKAKLTITVASTNTAGSKTVVPDILQGVDSYKLTLTSKETPAFATKTKSFSKTEALVIEDIETGFWAIKLDALSAAGSVIASGTVLKNIKVENLSVVIELALVSGGKGALSLNIQFSTDVLVDSIVCALENSAYTLIPIDTALVTEFEGNKVATIIANDLNQGVYSLTMDFKQGTESLGVFTESVNVLSGLTSNKWVDSPGVFSDVRTISSSDFSSINARLSDLSLEGLNGTQFSFSSGSTNDDETYVLYDYPNETLNFTPTQFMSGQKITYTWNSSSVAPIITGSKSTALLVKEGLNTLTITVCAPNRSATKKYIIQINQTQFRISLSPVAMQMVKVPAGTFQRDSTATNTSYVSSFYIGKYEVSQAQYLAVMGVNPSSNTTAPSYVVDKINLYRAITFCNKLSLLEGLTPVYSVLEDTIPVNWNTITHGAIPTINNNYWNAVTMDLSANGYRLPTEMEWRWAAMGASKDARPGAMLNGVNVSGYNKGYAGSTESGNLQDNIGNYSWYQYNSGVGETTTEPRSIKSVGTKMPNELGIYDMTGNVWEWCWDVLAEYPVGSLTNYTGSSNARNDSQTSMFVGAGYDDTPGVTSSFLLNNRANIDRLPYDGPTAVGFRVVRDSVAIRNGIVGEWLFDNSAQDTSGNSIHGTSYSNPQKTSGHKSDANSAYILGNPYIAANMYADNTPVTFSQSDSFSISVWFNATDVNPSYQYLVSKMGSVNQFNYYINIGAGKVYASVSKNNVGVNCVEAVVAPSFWNHVVLVYNGSAVSMYLNGEYKGITTFTQTTTSGPIGNDLTFGKGEGSFFAGSIDNVRIYNRVLSNAEIQALYKE